MAENNKMLKNRSNAVKKGFAFTVTILVVLFFMVTAITMWAHANEQKEKRISEKMKYYVLSQGMRILSDDVINRFANMSAYYALYKLSNWTVEHKLNRGYDLPITISGSPVHNSVGNVNESIYALLFNGSIQGSYFDPYWAGGRYTDDEFNDYTFPGFIEKVNRTCAALGLVCSLSEPKNFSFIQTSPWTVQLYFEMQRNITTMDGAAGIDESTVIVNQSFDIEGFIDPMVSEMMIDVDPNARRQMFPYHGDFNASVSDISISVNSLSGRGKGFFYGPVIDNLDEEITNNTWKYIMKTTWEDLAALPSTDRTSIINSYGAFIITDVSINENVVNWTGEQSGTYTLTGYCGGTRTWTGTLYCRLLCQNRTYSEENCQFDCINETSACTDKVYKICLNSGGYEDPCFDGLVNCGPGRVESVLSRVDPATEATLCDFVAAGLITSIDMDLTDPIDKPYIVTPSSTVNLGDPASNYPFGDTDSNEKDRNRVLINNENWVNTSDFNTLSDSDKEDRRNELFDGYHELWDIEDLREMGLCESYVYDDDAGGGAPSFFQRMVKEGYDLRGYELSIESFVIGRWAVEDYSKVDWEYAQDLFGAASWDITIDDYLKGMSGNKMSSMVVDPGSPIGHFGLSTEARARYALTDTIECGRDVKCS